MKGKLIAAKIFMVIGCVFTGLFTFLIGFIWTIPMTVVLFRRTRDMLPLGMGFKICTFLFVNTIAGLILFCTDTQTYYDKYDHIELL